LFHYKHKTPEKVISQLPVAQYLFVPISEVDFALQEGETKSLE
jgi:hypothetical protein